MIYSNEIIYFNYLGIFYSSYNLFPVQPRKSVSGSRKTKQMCPESRALWNNQQVSDRLRNRSSPRCSFFMFFHFSDALLSLAEVCVSVWVLENQYFDSGSKLLEVVEQLKVNATLMHQRLQQARP